MVIGDSAAPRRVTAPLLALALVLADVPTALAQAPAPALRVEGPALAGTMQLAGERPRRTRRQLDPATRELRTTRGILAGGIFLTAACGVGFGVLTAVIVDRWSRLYGSSGERMVTLDAALLACTAMSIAAIGVSGRRLRTLRGRVAWAGGLGLRF